MPTRYDDEDDRETGSRDREISLGTGTVLGIFLALAVVCSLFFGLGYSMGRKSAPAPTTPAVSAVPVYSPPLVEGEKPSPLDSAAPSTGRSHSNSQVTQPLDGSSKSEEDLARPGAHGHLAAPRPADAESRPTLGPSLPGAVPIYVQVAAVSRKEDADLLLSALKKRGYLAIIRQQTPDKLLHVQVGPFPSKKEAEDMRKRLIGDGYNPILK